MQSKHNMNNVFNIQFNKLGKWLIPTFLRKDVLMSIVTAVYAPIVSLHNLFLQYRKAKFYAIAMNFETCYLESFLNDRFDFALRRIYIDDAPVGASTFIYMQGEERPLVLTLRSETAPQYMYTRGESGGDILYDFIVYVPIGVQYDDVEIRAMLATKISGKRYKIQTY